MKIYTVTQTELDQTPQADHHWRWPGVTGPGQYTWSEAEDTYHPVRRVKAAESTAIFGIGGIGIATENETPIIPSARAVERVQRMHDTDVVCRRCGASQNFDGAMFTTGGGDICDDCF
jgi:hypothetical protein